MGVLNPHRVAIHHTGDGSLDGLGGGGEGRPEERPSEEAKLYPSADAVAPF